MALSEQTLKIENNYLIVAIDDAGRATLSDKITGISWEPFPHSQGSMISLINSEGQHLLADLELGCRVNVSKTANLQLTIKYRSLHIGDRLMEDFTLTVTLDLLPDQAVVELTLVSLELSPGMQLESLTYPHHLFALRTARDDGYIVVPSNQGVIIPTQFDTGFMRFQHNTWSKIADQEHTMPFNSGRLNMPWFGAVKREDDQQVAILAYVETSADTSLKIICNKVVATPTLARTGVETSQGVRLSTVTPIWQGCHGQLAYRRHLRLEMIPNGDYVALAKRYRALSIACGNYRSLKDKIEENPLMERLIGAPDIKIYIYTHRLDKPYYRAGSQPVLTGYERVHTTFAQVEEMVIDLHDNLGVDRAMILLGGWIQAGYDRQHPDVWPPTEKAGGIDGLKKASQAAVDKGYLFSLHDNYQDMYPDAPRYDTYYIMRNQDGSLMRGGIWDGGPCQLINAAYGIKLAKPTVDAVQTNTSTNSYYLDTTTSAPLYESYGDKHPLTRSQDKEEKLGLLKWLQSRGFIVGAEAGTDWAIGVCGFFEGLPGSAVGFFDGVTGKQFGISAPLFSLVYHDAVVMYWQHGQPFGREDHENHVLHDLLSANPSSWSLIAGQWDDLKPLISEAANLLGKLHRRTAHQQMTNHKFLSEDYCVQESRFEDGTRVVVNFGITSYHMGDYTIAPKGFFVENPDEGVVQGAFNRHCQITKRI